MNKKLTMALACIMGATALRASTVLWDPFTLEKITDGDFSYYHLRADYWNWNDDYSKGMHLYSDLFFYLNDVLSRLYAMDMTDDAIYSYGHENWVEATKYCFVGRLWTRKQKKYFYHIGMDDPSDTVSCDYSIGPTWDSTDQCWMVYLACALPLLKYGDDIPEDDSYPNTGIWPVYGWVSLKIDKEDNSVELVHSAVDLDGDPIARSYVPPPPTPEPASGALLLSGCLLLCARRRRRAAVKCCQCGIVASCQQPVPNWQLSTGNWQNWQHWQH